MEVSLTFTPDGNGRGLYTDALPLAEIGRLVVERATTIEFDNRAQCWRVRDRTGFAMFNSPSRHQCLNWEREFLQTQEDMKHELQPGAGSVTVGA